MDVTTATRSRRNAMSENAIDSENTSKPAPDTAKPKGKRKPAKAAKKAGRGSSSMTTAGTSESIAPTARA
jgi:hypothetical protein